MKEGINTTQPEQERSPVEITQEDREEIAEQQGRLAGAEEEERANKERVRKVLAEKLSALDEGVEKFKSLVREGKATEAEVQKLINRELRFKANSIITELGGINAVAGLVREKLKKLSWLDENLENNLNIE